MRFVLPLICAASAASAADFRAPEGCSVHLTVQQRGCVVAHHWTCEGEADGVQWSAELDADGMSYLGQIDGEAQWLKSYFYRLGEEESLIQPARDPASLSTLLAEGLDTFDFDLNTTNGIQRVVGFDQIIERGVVIDGQVLHRTAYEIALTDSEGAVVFEATGQEFVSETYRRFFSGTGDVTAPDAFSYNESPVDFIQPGQPGFLARTPIYDCAAMTAQLKTTKEDILP